MLIHTTSVGNAGRYSGGRSSQPGPGLLHRLVPHVRIRAGAVPENRRSVIDILDNEQVLVSAGHFTDLGHFVVVEGRRSWRGIQPNE